jgi:hypothetical protein
MTKLGTICGVCSREFDFSRGRYDGRPVKAWKGMMVCDTCIKCNHDGIVPRTYPHLIPKLEMMGIEVTLNDRGFLNIPE